jgi:hypothetical protein
MAPLAKDRWRAELEAATSDDEVLHAARRYLESIGPRDMGALPERLMPRTLQTCGQIAEWALKLVRENLHASFDEQDANLLRDMGEFFAMASARLASLHSRDRR